MMPLVPNRNTRPMPCASDGMSMGSVMMTAKAPLPLMRVRHSTHDTASAATRDMQVDTRATDTEFRHAEANCSLANTSRASGLARLASSPTKGMMTAKRKKAAKAMRITLNPPPPAATPRRRPKTDA